MKPSLEVILVATKLGLTSFGGPVAHLGYFHDEYVKRQQWIDEKQYLDLVAMCQFLPGPASSQLGIAIGLRRAGLLGGFLAWLGFTWPSALVLTLFAVLIPSSGMSSAALPGWLHGLMIVAVAVVIQAVWSMSRTLTPDRPRATLAIVAALLILLWPTAWTQILLMITAGIIGWMGIGGIGRTTPATASHVERQQTTPARKRTSIVALSLLLLILAGVPLIRVLGDSQGFALFDSFFRVGSLVFGGGHVVLPLLQTEVVGPGWLTNDQFLTGYGAAQAVPGPLFTFSAYLGAMIYGGSSAPIAALGGAIIALVAMFLPSFLLVIGVLPFWDHLRKVKAFQSALTGINASVVGILLAALYNPVWTGAIHSVNDFAMALVAFALLMIWKQPPWIVVLFGIIGGWVLM